MGDANTEIAFGAVAASLVIGGIAGGLTHAADPDAPAAVIGTLAGLAGGALALGYLWKEEQTPGSWANPNVSTIVPASGTTPASASTGPANATPPTPLGTTIAVFGVLGTIGAAVTAVSILYDLHQASRGKEGV